MECISLSLSHSVCLFISMVRSHFICLPDVYVCVCRLCGVLINTERKGELTTGNNSCSHNCELREKCSNTLCATCSVSFGVAIILVVLFVRLMYIQCWARIPKYHFEFLLIVLQQHVKCSYPPRKNGERKAFVVWCEVECPLAWKCVYHFIGIFLSKVPWVVCLTNCAERIW